jgi:glycosyltransferase involved in cell wall biosynthesis
MKIVHIITRLIIGGAQENTLISCREQARRGHKVYLITGSQTGAEGTMFDKAAKMDFEVIVVADMIRSISAAADIRAYRHIKKILLDIKPDVVHTHSAKAGILGRLAGWNIKGIAPFCENPDKPAPMVVHTIHGLAFHDYQSRWLNKLYIAIERFAAGKCDAIIGVAETMNRKSLAAGIGSSEMYSTAYSAIDTERFLTPPPPQQIKDFRRKYGISDQSKVIICVARLAELKGHDYIIESARKLAGRFPDCMWLFVGDGALTSQIKDKIHVGGLGYKIRLSGLLNPEQIPTAIHSSDILVHCSLREGLARVLPQAMLCGKPVISFDIDGAAEVVNENTGRLIAPEDVDALTAASTELLSDASLCHRLGENGRELVKEMFSPKAMSDAIEKVYNSY